MLKNESVYPFKDGDYTKPHQFAVEGTYEEIGFDLGKLTKNEYGCKLGVSDHPIDAEARREYMATNWSQMLRRNKGAQRAYGLPEDDGVISYA